MKMPEYVAVKIMPDKKGTSYSLEVVADTDFVNVVRCKDCKYYEETRPFSVIMTVCKYGDHTEWTEPNGYCHRAKRAKHEETT